MVCSITVCCLSTTNGTALGTCKQCWELPRCAPWWSCCLQVLQHLLGAPWVS